MRPSLKNQTVSSTGHKGQRKSEGFSRLEETQKTGQLYSGDDELGHQDKKTLGGCVPWG